MIKLFTILGLITTILLVVLFNHLTGYEIHSFALWFVIPVGGGLVGAGAASGLFYGYLRYNKPVTGKVYLLGMLLGIIAFYGIYYVSYVTTYVDSDNKTNYSFKGDPLSTYEFDGQPITFSKYLELKKESVTHQIFYRVPIHSGEYTTGKTTNTLSFYLQLLAAIIGGAVVGLAIIDKKKFCKKCKRYSQEKELFKFNIDDYDVIFKKLLESIKEISKLEELIKDTKFIQEKGKGYISVEQQYCPNCFESVIKVKAMRPTSDSFEEVEKLTQVFELSPEIARWVAKPRA